MRGVKRILLAFFLLSEVERTSAFSSVVAGPKKAPSVSPATGLTNQFYTWKEEQQIRYQVAGPVNGPPVLLVHGLFVNSDHWRKTLCALSDAGYRAYAIDLLGCGYSDKPAADSVTARKLCGEVSRFEDSNDQQQPSILRNVELGTSRGGNSKRIADVDLRHPLGSPYNFFTWSDLLTDFTRQVILKGGGSNLEQQQQVTMVCNSIGTISTLQAVLDHSDLYTGVFVVSPNFRELHSAEMPLPAVTMPVLRAIQGLLRQQGQGLFDAAAVPDTVKRILQEPYARTDAVDDVLVQVLLDPLLTVGASQVVFDTLSYSAGPLPEQQLSLLGGVEKHKPVWIVYGLDDPWTPAARVDALAQFAAVEHVQGFDGVGHCPHDEAPELVHPVLFDFLDRLLLQHQQDTGSSIQQQ